MGYKTNISCSSILEVNYDGILALQLEHKVTMKQMGVCVSYLPPEGGERGQDSQGFFDQLLNIAYQCSDLDVSMFAGDLNARTGLLNDYVINVDNVTPRESCDKVKN